MRRFHRHNNTRNPVHALLSLPIIIMLACSWYLGGLGSNLTPKDVLVQQVFSKNLPLQLHKGVEAAQSIVLVALQHYKMPPRSKRPSTSSVSLLAAAPLSAHSARRGTHRRDTSSPPRVLCQVSLPGIFPSWARACVFLYIIPTLDIYTCASTYKPLRPFEHTSVIVSL